MTTEFVQLKTFSFYFNDHNTISLIRIQKFLHQTQSCAPILYSFNKIPIVWTRMRHSVIVSHSTNGQTMLEDVYFANVKHIFWGNPHTISINPTLPMNAHTVSARRIRTT